MINCDCMKARDSAVYRALCGRSGVMSFTPYFAFRKVAVRKEVAAFAEEYTIQSKLGVRNERYINVNEISVPDAGSVYSKKERHSQAYDELVNHLVWNGLSIERFWLIYGR
jgi:hypothetical protein